MDLPTSELDATWTNSKSVDLTRERPPDCFTTRAVRINKCDDVMNLYTTKAINNWTAAMCDDADRKVGHAFSSVGNVSSFIFPECSPDKAHILAYFTQVSFIHDDALSSKDSKEENKHLSHALDPKDNNPGTSERGKAMKKFLSQTVLELIDMDTNEGQEFVKNLKVWADDEIGLKNPQTIECVDEYLHFRRLNGGIKAYWHWLAFSHEDRFTQADWDSIEDLLKSANRVFILTNDYFSWPRERLYGQGRIANVIEFYMRTEGLSEEEAKQRTKEEILQGEHLFHNMCVERFAREPNLPRHVKKLLQVAEVAMGGYNYWASTCPRLNSWKEQAPTAETDFHGSKNDEVSNPTGKAELVKPVKTNQTSGKIQAITKVQSLPSVSHFTCTSDLDDSALLAPAHYVESLSSKNVLSKLVEAFNVWMQVPPKPLAAIKHVLDDLHNSSLILDDIQDNSPLRRGRTATHLIFGPAQSINSATYMFVKAAQTVDALGTPQMMTAFLQGLETLFIGQSWDISWRQSFHCPTESEYLSAADKKTGALLTMMVELMQCNAKTLPFSYRLSPLARLFGRWYQVRDDYMNLQGADYSKQKGFCEDLDEGKLSYPILKCCQKSETNKGIILGIFRQMRMTNTKMMRESKLHILDLMSSARALEDTFDYLQQLQQEIERDIREIEVLAGESNPELLLLVKVLGAIPKPGKKGH
ncbi:Terpenoid synthase [Penicillium griseofulvum]|uniref:Geranylfarnesol n=1 Tax=Penicillium patulum TaxID=5078 RepID=A0A135LYJ9_PENPA|nr:Terpenoid synthase [Penicillium griseofulvum]KXG54038.1 Terpenoid synthase [Penicillium griseofulvum]QXF69082.1 geranylfarnesol [Penicillium griseofulvum]